MKNFPIEVNDTVLYFDDIAKFRQRTNRLEAIKYIMQKSGYVKDEAENS